MMSIFTDHDTDSKAKGWIRGSRPPRDSAVDSTHASRPDSGSSRDAMRLLVEQDRYLFALLETTGSHSDEASVTLAREALAAKMALIPAGQVPIVLGSGQFEMRDIPAVYIDRLAVTNRQFQQFVDAGCYDRLELWPREVWPSLMKFTDRTLQPGPEAWERGRPPLHKADHPVVGICWHEAQAYAQWVGKRLPTAAEWQKIAGFPDHLGGGCRFPWGDLFDPARGNFWSSARGDTVAVTAYPNGDTPNGIRQLAGNVWEWLADPLDSIPCDPGESFESWKPMRRIAGGAFDTYLSNEAACYFITGQAELDRRPNIGFRCAVSADAIPDNVG